MKQCGLEIELDRLDLGLLSELQRDAAQTNQALAARVHVSPATCMRRVRALVDSGVVQRRVALLDATRVGPVLQAVVEVTLDRQGVEHLDAFEQRVALHPAVQQCYRVSPGPDFVLIACVQDMPAWARVVGELFTQDGNVRNVKSFFVVRNGKFEPALPLIERK